MENSNSSALSDGAQQADMVSNENAETKFGADQGETNMVKLVDGKLTPIGDTTDDVVDEQLRNRYSSDEERTVQGDPSRGKTYENSEASLHVGGGVDEAILPNDPIAVADITGNPDAGSTVETGLLSEDEPNASTKADAKQTSTNSFAGWNYIGGNHPFGYDSTQAMIPPTPGTPDPTQPVPGIPETPPTPPQPGPEIPDLPETPKPPIPDINARTLNTYTSTLSPSANPKTGNAETGTQYEGIHKDLAEASTAVPGTEEGMKDKPDTGESARPYDVDAKDPAANQPGERPEEAQEAAKFPPEMADESSIAAQDMISGPDRSDQKSTEGLDRKYNDLDATREMAT